jgi:peptidoglycan/LPS O-acetylase OafA/YrhL
MGRDRHLPILDCFRGLAILFVVGLHCLSGQVKALSLIPALSHQSLLKALIYFVYTVLDLGVYGVAIFFVVSGFCIHLSYRRSQSSGWLVFYTRRIFRLYPAYLCSLFFFIVVLPSTRWSEGMSKAHWLDLALHLSLAHNLLPQTFATIDEPYWSLAIEFQLYLLFPLLLLMANRIGWRQTLAVTAVVEFVSRISLTVVSLREPEMFPPDWWGWINLSPFGFWFSWSLGAALAEAFVEKRKLPFADGPLPLWIWPVLVIIFHDTPFLKNFTFPIAALGSTRFLAYFLVREPFSLANASAPFVRCLTFIGTISYSLYLLHLPLYGYFMSFLPKAHGSLVVYAEKFVWIGWSLTIVILMSYLLFLFIEAPGIKLGKRVVAGLR